MGKNMGWQDTYEVNFDYYRTYTKLEKWSTRPSPIIKLTITEKGLIKFWLILKNDMVQVQGGTKGMVNIFYNKETSPSEAIEKLRKHFVDDEGRTCDWKPKKLAQGKLVTFPRELLARWVDLEEKIIKPLLSQLPVVSSSVSSDFFGIYTVPPRVRFTKNVELDVEKEPLFKDLKKYPCFKPILRMLGQFRRGSDEFWGMKLELHLKIYDWVKSGILRQLSIKEWKSRPSGTKLELAESFLRFAILLVEEGKAKFDEHLNFLKQEKLNLDESLLLQMGREGLSEWFIEMSEEIRGSMFSADAVKLHRKIKKLEGLRSRIEKELKIIWVKGRSPGGLWVLLKP